MKRELFDEMNNHLLKDEKPSEYFNSILQNEPLNCEYPFTILSELTKIKQSPEHHPEGNVWNHTMLVLDKTALRKDQSTDKRVFMWSALLHDVGKAPTTRFKNGKYTAYDHDKAGRILTEKFLLEFTDDNEFIGKVSDMVRWHMQILYIVNDLPYAEVEKMKRQVSVKEIALLGLCDLLGRKGAISERKGEEKVKIFLKKCNVAVLFLL